LSAGRGFAFEFATAGRIAFGPGALEAAAAAAPGLGRRALLVLGSGSTAAPAAELARLLSRAGVGVEVFRVRGEPDEESVAAGVAAARADLCDLVVALGGGSVLDAAKAVASLAPNPGQLRDYVEVVGKGQPLTRPALPVIALPTTAGTGSEVTRNSVIAMRAERVKVSLRGPELLPRLALVDPELTHSLPPEVTAATGLDALTQLIEPLTSCRATPLSDAIASLGLGHAVRSLVRAHHTGDPQARRDLALASLCGGLALANSGLGAVHGLAAVIGGRHAIAHGACCAMLLGPVVAVNFDALLAREPQSPALARYAQVAAVLASRPKLASAPPGEVRHALVHELTALTGALGIGRLAGSGVTAEEIPAIARAARDASSMKGNPIVLEQGEVEDALERAL
jgi:alcohol dehydrogenase class IV